jgi:hypothetical protein
LWLSSSAGVANSLARWESNSIIWNIKLWGFNNNYPMIDFLGGEIVSDTSNIGKMNLAKNTF